MLSGVAEFVILGVSVDGELFEPQDWAVNLCNMLGTVAPDGRMIFSSYARPTMIDGVQCMVVRASLEKVDPKTLRCSNILLPSIALKCGLDVEAVMLKAKQLARIRFWGWNDARRGKTVGNITS